MQIQPYLQFDGRCEEAIEFYKTALGAQLEQLMRFKDKSDTAMVPPGSGNKVMHSSFRIGNTRVMASDGYCKGSPNFEGFSLSIMTPDAEADRLFKLWRTAARCRCHSPNHSSLRALAWRTTASACRG